MTTEAFLREITGVRGLSGDERPVAEFVRETFAPLCDEVRVDPLFSVVARKKGPGPKVAFFAHTDEIGLMVVKVEADGSLRVNGVGGVDPRILPGQRVTVFGKQTLPGVVGAKAPHLLTDEERKKNYRMQDVHVDLGLAPEKVRELVQIGDQVQLEHRYTELKNGRVAVKTCDDRACVAVMYHALTLLKGLRHDADLYFVATSQEEVGTRGALTSSFGVDPDFAVALDVCHADTPGAPPGRTHKLDSPVASMGPFIQPFLRGKLMDAAKAHRVPVQHGVVPGATYTDADAVATSRGGIPTVLLELPLKYMHTTVEQIDLGAMTECGRLLAHFAADVRGDWEDALWN
ncbi:MAG TPA: M20/M25/M40 family metallo-hydrolase [Candidatus Limnocylindria bacterium]|nr:M20/M25/M40 family metallo-hydrolase [Candidatus Limnocylindria bacterium]